MTTATLDFNGPKMANKLIRRFEFHSIVNKKNKPNALEKGIDTQAIVTAADRSVTD